MSEEEKKFLEIVDLKKGFGSGQTRQEVLRGMNFSVAKGEFCVLLGPSGSGKSTLLNIIGGIDNADSGYININGDKLEDMSEKKLTQYRRKHLGYVFQMYNLIANLNVKENIEVGAYLSDNALDIDDLLHTLGLYEHRYKLPNQLSGGQQQRVSIGRAIVKNPDILDFLSVDGLRFRYLNLFDKTVYYGCGQLFDLCTFHHFIGKLFRFAGAVLQIVSRSFQFFNFFGCFFLFLFKMGGQHPELLF